MIKKIFLLCLAILFFILSPFWISVNAWLESPWYKVDVWELGLGWEKAIDWNNWVSAVKYSLKIIVEKLLIAIWVVALIIMSIWGWYMIFSGGKDELLNKWKSIFIAWIVAMVVALSAWILMKVVIYLVYS